MKVSVLLIGYLEQYIKSIKESFQDISISVIEESSLIPNNKIEGVKVFTGKYQQNNEALSVAIEINKTEKFNAVIPLREYAVPLCNDIATELGLLKIGRLASRCFRDKYLLRTTLSQMNLKYIKQPNFLRIENIDDLYEFYNKQGLCIIKPSNKQATVGVFKIISKDQISEFYQKSVNADEPGRLASDRKLIWEYQAEQLIEGSEYSVEMFVKNGNIIFFNVTKKITDDGAVPFEIGHMLPVSIFDAHQSKAFRAVCEELVNVMEVENSVLHSEWMVSGNEIFLIECAARAPGGHITDLLNNSYEFQFFHQYLNLMMGLELSEFSSPSRITAIRQFTPARGIVKEVIKDISSLSRGVIDGIKILSYLNNMEKGDYISVENNQSRAGHIIIEGTCHKLMNEKLTQISSTAIITE
ncbi:ATP-grasp domain-containing protein [Xenorhabdus bovienii]|uniref:ATP-grasp domain-containing protein n=1 Tax=Xenorhabdus bovienii TaxID=40576 RepID=UPI0023B24CA3|nr:ATP-grasp domain-containing protein [Xenorhabdus bovienii]MDE9453250.1 ATP-grasp domain-containing protein [Xenorhabdus bovienii]